MDISRVFVRGLPPTINESDFRKHFSRGHITDIKIIPNRRLGFVGYASPEEARQAVKLFNKSFIRMMDESNPKFQEYLNVMQHAKNSANLVHGMDVDGLTINTPTTADQPKVDGSASDDEYEVVPERPAKRVSRQTDQTAASIPSHPSTAKETPTDTVPAPVTDDGSTQQMEVDESNEPAATTVPATDDEWLRNRTNRLLDLVDDDDISPELLAPSQAGRQEPQKQQTEPAALPHRLPPKLKSRNPYQSLRRPAQKIRCKQYVHIPADRSSANNKGLAFVSFAESDSAVAAFQAIDGATFQGRLLHVLPASRKRDHNLDEFALSKLPLKTQAKIRKKAQASTSKFNWSTLYMSQDAVNTSVADRLGVSKSELLDPTSIDLNSFKSTQRGDTVILVKGFAYGTSPQELRELFEQHGQVLKVLMPPTGTIAIVQFAHANEEKGPKVLFTEQQLSDKASGEANKEKLSASELLDRGDKSEPETSTLFIKGLNFATRTPDLGVLSMGFGFIEMTSKEAAEAAMKAMDGYELQGHKLQVRLSHRGHDAAEEQRRADNAKKLANQHSKVLIKNVPFQATKKDMRSLFSSYGQLRAVRLPKNMNSRSRGYAFVEFTSPSEAQNAVAALQDTHLLGRRLVIQYAEADTIDPEMEIEKMQKKVAGQVNKVRLQQLTGQDRKKITLEGEDEDGEV
ncbi:multiple RNA-binding domain-containing protein 1 [Apiospora hydei]|uniref:Multiple RNA-binding domain-containing protein 1 n=1 Tax=Apiospora hydei TaxID=1337664 RepID=A0ABR1VXC3_9PEZI